MDTVEQTIEKLLATIRDLSELAQITIIQLDPSGSVRFQRKLNEIMDKHNNQY
jgi:hypothetical protein